MSTSVSKDTGNLAEDVARALNLRALGEAIATLSRGVPASQIATQTGNRVVTAAPILYVADGLWTGREDIVRMKQEKLAPILHTCEQQSLEQDHGLIWCCRNPGAFAL